MTVSGLKKFIILRNTLGHILSGVNWEGRNRRLNMSKIGNNSLLFTVGSKYI